jgi:hypothetical protein
MADRFQAQRLLRQSSHQAIKILLPDKIQKAADLLGKLGYQKQVGEFILSMTRDVCAGHGKKLTR